MAKQRKSSSRNQRSRNSSERARAQAAARSSTVQTNSFVKGMNKDIAPSFETNKSWWHARNLANNSEDGDLATVGNEPSNLSCGVIPYTIIGAIHKYGDEWIVYSTDDVNSEIGLFDDSQCKYTVLVNDACLDFKKKFLITGAAKENFDCSWQVYWDDGNNPSRSLNIDNIPYKQVQVSGPDINGQPCSEYVNIEPLQLDCEQIRLAPLLNTPCLELTKSTDGGQLRNGGYQAFVAYVENEVKVTDYIGVSNIQTLWSHEGSGGSLNISLSNLDTDYDFFVLVILRRNQGQTDAKQIGFYSTQTEDINIDFIDPSLVGVSLTEIPQMSPAYEKSESMFVVNDWLLRQGPVEQFDFNYQPIANNIKTEWVINQVPENYYAKGGNKYNFLRDEQYAFFIRWIYNTGERSSSYHIPGRAPQQYTLPNGNTVAENSVIFGTNVLDPNGDKLYKAYNTASITSLAPETTDGVTTVARGEMGYWESSERYPTNRPDIWGDLCGEFIRHHKMPDESIGGAASPLHLTSTSGDLLNILGVQFSNIGRPKFNDGTYITNIVGYEILRGSRLGAKSILAKGLFRNMRKYDVPNAEALIGTNVQGLYPNYPYNDLRPDIYFHTGGSALNRTDGCDTFSESMSSYTSLGDGPDVNGEPRGFSRKVFTLASPDLMFTRPFLNAYETKIYGSLSGNSSGYFKPSEEHPQFKLIRGSAALIGAVIGLGYALRQVRGTENRDQTSNTSNLTSQSGKGQEQRGGGGSVSLTVPPGFASVNLNGRSGGDWQQPDGNIQESYEEDNEEEIPRSVASILALSSEGIPEGLLQSIIGSIEDFLDDPEEYLKEQLEDTLEGGDKERKAEIEAAEENAKKAARLPGVAGGVTRVGINKDTSTSNIPPILRKITGVFSQQTNIAIGGNEIIEFIYNLTPFSDHAWKYNSQGRFTDFQTAVGETRIKTTDSNYLRSSFQSFDEGTYKINNLYRPTTVAVSLEKEVSDPVVEDKSRFSIGGELNMTLNASGEFVNTISNPFGKDYLVDPRQPRKSPISAHYGALKFNFDNQYGQLAGIKQVQMRGCVELLDPEKPDEFLYASKPIFAGDTFIGRYTEKVIMPIFSNYLFGQPDGFTFDYSLYVNIPYPRWWLNSTKYDLSPLAQVIATLGLSFLNTNELEALMPNDLFYLDRGSDSCQSALGAIFSAVPIIGSLVTSDDPNPALSLKYAYMYTHSNGILDFHVESTINLDQRDWEDEPSKRIYSIYDYNDLDELFHAQIEKEDNFYKYDDSLSPDKFPTQLSSFGTVQELSYDPLVAENCFVSYPKRLIYSLQAQEESRKDFWRVFLNFNYKDFKNDVSVIKPINKSGALIFFPHLSPQMFQGVDTLKTQLDTKLTIGDGGLFSQPFQNVANADVAMEYGSVESIRGVINTPVGLFFISQAQGKIFQYGKGGITPISNAGMKWWFAKYLPSKFIKQFPNSEESVWTDNPVSGVGCQVVYDSVDDIVYFMKKDYQLKPEYIASATFTDALVKPVIIETQPKVFVNIDIGDPIYFDDCSWTCSYDPKSKAWISFHDWHPELAIASINHFFTTKTIESVTPICPPGYSFNSTSGVCEQVVGATLPKTVTVDEVVSTLTGGPVNCLVDVVVAMDTSGSTNQSGRRQAQLTFLTGFLNDPDIQALLDNQQMQIGFTQWGTNSQVIPNSGFSMCADPIVVNPNSIPTYYDNNWVGFASTNCVAGLDGAVAMLNDTASSELGDRSSNPNFRRVILFVTDTTTDPGVVGEPYQSSTVGNGNGPANQFLYAIYCGANDSQPVDGNVLNHITMTNGPANVDPYQFGINASDTTTIQPVVDALSGAVCGTDYECNCPTGYEIVYFNPATSYWDSATGECSEVNTPRCRKVTCECPNPPLPPGSIITESGDCPDSPPLIYEVGPTADPSYINPNPPQCTFDLTLTAQANYFAGGFWRHNVRCDSFANFYNIDYPWEIDIISNTGQAVNTVRSFEYQLESFVYKGDPQYNMCGGDKWEDPNFNFDAAIVYNTDQTSGLLVINQQPVNDPWGGLTYPQINANNIDIIASKVEHKFRFNQFWDVTNDRGEFANSAGITTEQSIFNTECNGYIRNLNSINLNYNKSALQRKKFRHYSNHVILRRNLSGNKKMLLRLNNTKLLLSKR